LRLNGNVVPASNHQECLGMISKLLQESKTLKGSYLWGMKLRGEVENRREILETSLL
jgi:hypothetical protein